MAIQIIKESEIAASAVASLPSRPNAQPQFGGRGYTAKELKEAFDRLPRLIVQRLNALIEALNSGELLSDISLPLGDGTLQDFVEKTESALAHLAEDVDIRVKEEDVVDTVTDTSLSPVTSRAVYEALTTHISDMEREWEGVRAYMQRLSGLHLTCGRDYIIRLVDEDGTTYGAGVDLPMESVVVGATYDEASKAITLTLQNGESLSFGIGDLVEGLVTEEAFQEGLEKKQDVLAFDTAPTAESGKPVTSGGVFDGLMQTKVDTVAQVVATLETGQYDKESGRILYKQEGAVVAGAKLPLGEYATKAAVEEKLLHFTNILAQNILTEETVTDTYSIRQTAEGEGILDEVYTTVHCIAGDTTPTEDGVAHTVISGIQSVGKNLFPLLTASTKASILNGDIVCFTADPKNAYIAGAYVVDMEGDVTDYLVDGETYTLLQDVYPKSFSTPGSAYWRLERFDTEGKSVVYTTCTQPFTFTVDKTNYPKYALQIQTGTTSGYAGKQYQFAFVRGEKELPTAGYREDILSFPPLELGRWDYLDVKAGQLVRRTVVATQDTPYTEEELSNLGDYVLSLDGKTVAYQGDAPSYEAMEISPTYFAYTGGEERILPLGSSATVTQTYLRKAGSEV